MSTQNIIDLANSYAACFGRAEPSSKDFKVASRALWTPWESPDHVASLAMKVWTNDRFASPAPARPMTLAEKAKGHGKDARRARQLLRSGRFSGQETRTFATGEWR